MIITNPQNILKLLKIYAWNMVTKFDLEYINENDGLNVTFKFSKTEIGVFKIKPIFSFIFWYIIIYF